MVYLAQTILSDSSHPFVVAQFFAAKSDQYAEEDQSKPEEPRHVWISRKS